VASSHGSTSPLDLPPGSSAADSELAEGSFSFRSSSSSGLIVTAPMPRRWRRSSSSRSWVRSASALRVRRSSTSG
jgi:hypothetical protein